MSLCVVAVKVVLVPEGHVMTAAFAIGLRIQELKRHLASELRVPAEVLQISLDGTVWFSEIFLAGEGFEELWERWFNYRRSQPDACQWKQAHPLLS